MVRLKNRYLVVNYLYPSATPAKSKEAVPDLIQFHQPTPDKFSIQLLLSAIREGVAELFGDYGLGMIASSLKVNYHSTAASTSIIRCPHAHYQMVWAALTFMTKLPGPINTQVVVKVVRVSGTIKKAEEEVIKRAKELVLRAKIAGTGVGDQGPIQDIMKAVEKRREAEVLAEVEDGEEESESD